MCNPVFIYNDRTQALFLCEFQLYSIHVVVLELLRFKLIKSIIQLQQNEFTQGFARLLPHVAAVKS